MTFARLIIINVWSFSFVWLTEIAASVLVARPFRISPSLDQFATSPRRTTVSLSLDQILHPMPLLDESRPSHSILHPCHSTMTFSLFTMRGANLPIVCIMISSLAALRLPRSLLDGRRSPAHPRIAAQRHQEIKQTKQTTRSKEPYYKGEAHYKGEAERKLDYKIG
ncbi:hypothetical protein C8J56DRAFT_964153 [Mycena floridula]|nr:hypothetical protein C8J56DRAFT_964153 [Mycena floridula]